MKFAILGYGKMGKMVEQLLKDDHQEVVATIDNEEEWGFMGTLVVFALYIALVIRILSLSEKQRTPFARYYGYGIAGIIVFHFFINIGMTIGLVPIIGIPLPFISYGGSSLWAFTMMLFVFIKLNDN